MKKLIAWLFIGLVVLFIVIMALPSKKSSTSVAVPTVRATVRVVAPKAAPTSRYRTVTYRVSGKTAEASLTYQNAQGGTEQEDVQLYWVPAGGGRNPRPWEKTFTAPPGTFVYLSAQNKTAFDHDLIVEILVDGQPWKSSTSVGAYKIATCNGALP